MSNDLQNATYENTPKYSLAGRQLRAKCVKVYDGDTCQLAMRIHPDDPLSRFSCRMMGYNSAEIKTKDAAEKQAALLAKSALESMILNEIVSVTIGDFDKYGRLLVVLEAKGGLVNNKMISGGFGAPYLGKGPKLWT